MMFRRPSDSERGAILPLTGILIIVLLVFAALTVDLGAAWAQRRQNQSAADAAVMAGALNVVTGGGTNPAVIAKVQEFVDKNLDPDVTADDWMACTDGEVDGVNFVALDSLVTQCISISAVSSDGARILRVKLPTRHVNTAFARIIGINTIATSAFAEAELYFGAGGGALPFVVPFGSSIEYCIGDVPGGLANDPCDGPKRGKFGYIDSPFHGTTNPGTAACDGPPPYPNLNERLELNIALGLDHHVFEAGGNDLHPDWNPDDGADTCDAKTVGYFPWALNLGSGNPGPTALTAGFAGSGPYGTTALLFGRLRQGGGLFVDDAERALPDGGGNNVVWLDNVGLWEYLTKTAYPGDNRNKDCNGNHPDYSEGGPTATDRLEQCLRTGSPMFVKAIVDSPRFAIIPRLWLNQTELGDAQPGAFYNIKEFVPAYIQTTFWNCSATECMAFATLDDPTPLDPSDDPQFFSPGEGKAEGCLIVGTGSCKNNVKLSLVGVTAWILDIKSVHEEAFGGGPDGNKPIFVRLFR